MGMWIVWLIVAAALVIVEVLTQMIWTLCLAVGCAGAMIANICEVPLAWQIVVMAVVSVVAFLVLMPWFKRWHESPSGSTDLDDRTGMDALIGRKAVVVQRIRPGGIGRARIDGDNWQVRAPGISKVIESGSEVVVVSYDSIILSVKPTSENY